VDLSASESGKSGLETKIRGLVKDAGSEACIIFTKSLRIPRLISTYLNLSKIKELQLVVLYL